VAAVTSAFFFLRRRLRRARLMLGDEGGLDGGAQPFRSEEDMPPPDYQRVFPQAGMALLSRIERAWPRFSTAKTRAANAARVAQLEHAISTLTPAMGDGQADDDRVGPRNANDASILAWKGRQPEAVAAGKKLEGDPIPIHLDHGSEDEPSKA
jgi:hypothetical protein